MTHAATWKIQHGAWGCVGNPCQTATPGIGQSNGCAFGRVHLAHQP